MPNIRKILFPVDFSESCYAAARYVELLAGQFQAEITLLHVVGMGEHTLAEELAADRRVKLDGFLADEFKYFTTWRRCLVGDAAEQIVAVAREFDPDLVMMPTRGLGSFRRLLIGSVTAKVLTDLDCPVWTGVHLENPKPLETIHAKRLVCAVDASERGFSVLEYASWLAEQNDATLALVHATPQLNGAYYGFGLEQEYAEAMEKEARKHIADLCDATGAQIDQIYINAGSPAAVVSCAARQFDADMLIMGRHSSTGIAGFLRPNGYAILRDSPCPAISI